MSQHSGSTLNLNDGFGVSKARWGRATPGMDQASAAPEVGRYARDGYTAARDPKQAARPSYLALRSTSTRPAVPVS